MSANLRPAATIASHGNVFLDSLLGLVLIPSLPSKKLASPKCQKLVFTNRISDHTESSVFHFTRLKVFYFLWSTTNTISQIDNKHQRTQMRCELVGTPNRKCLPWCGCRLFDSGPGHQRLFIGVLCTTSKMQSMGKIVALSKFSECNRNDRRTSWEVFNGIQYSFKSIIYVYHTHQSTLYKQIYAYVTASIF